MRGDFFQEQTIEDLLKTRRGGRLFHRESTNLEFKEQFNHAGWAEYLKDMTAFANNTGGYIVFGVKDIPHLLSGLSKKSLEMFESIDEEKITGYLLDLFSAEVNWQKTVFKRSGKSFGIIYILEARTKPVIAKKDEGKNNLIKNG